MSRSGFLGHLWQETKKNVIQSIEQEWQRVSQPFQGARQFLRPPGAKSNDHLFMALCTKCDACTAACPHGSISVHYGAGYPYDGTPVLANLADSPCLLCEDLPCIQSCPTEALSAITQLSDIRIGIAKIDNTTCIAYQGKACQICVDVCPFPGTAIELVEKLPQIYDACTGCGICQHHCPSTPKSIVVFPQ